MARKARKTTTKGGRPRKTGARFPGGKLRQIAEPNEKVVESRKALLGNLKVDLSVAEDAMALALAHGWLTEAQHRAGEAYARAYRLSHPQRASGGLNEAPEAANRDMRSISQMGSAEIVQAFDAILSSTQMPGASEQRQADARRRYNSMCTIMTPAEQSEVFLCFCLRSWPQWVNQRAAGRMETSWERKHVLLASGLDALHGHLQRSANRGNNYRNVRVA